MTKKKHISKHLGAAALAYVRLSHNDSKDRAGDVRKTLISSLANCIKYNPGCITVRNFKHELEIYLRNEVFLGEYDNYSQFKKLEDKIDEEIYRDILKENMLKETNYVFAFKEVKKINFDQLDVLYNNALEQMLYNGYCKDCAKDTISFIFDYLERMKMS